MLTFDLSTQSHATCRISQVYIKFEHFGIICFWVMLRTLVWKMHILTLWPWPLIPESLPLLGYYKVTPYTKCEHFGIIQKSYPHRLIIIIQQSARRSPSDTLNQQYGSVCVYVCVCYNCKRTVNDWNGLDNNSWIFDVGFTLNQSQLFLFRRRGFPGSCKRCSDRTHHDIHRRFQTNTNNIKTRTIYQQRFTDLTLRVIHLPLSRWPREYSSSSSRSASANPELTRRHATRTSCHCYPWD